MEYQRFRLAILFPLLAMFVVVVFAGGLGVTFILLNEFVIEEWAVVIAGMTLVIGVPTAAFLLERRIGQN